MPSFLVVVPSWLRTSISLLAWAVAGLAPGLIAGMGFGLRPDTAAALCLAGAMSALAARLNAFGPVFRHDLRRSARRGSVIRYRCLYASLLLLVLYLYCIAWTGRSTNDWLDVFQGLRVPSRSMSDFSDRFLMLFLTVQVAVVLLATPMLAAGAIAEEKERQTLEDVLATPVGDAELVLGKLAARVAHASLLLLTAVPVLALMQFLGGIDLELVLAGFLFTFLTLLTIASLSIAMSVVCPRTSHAIIATYVAGAGYLSNGSCCLPFLFHWGNPLLVLISLALPGYLYRGVAHGPPDPDGLLFELPSFALLNLVFTALLCGVAVAAVRRCARPLAWKLPESMRRIFPRGHPPGVSLDQHPLLWKEAPSASWGVFAAGWAGAYGLILLMGWAEAILRGHNVKIPQLLDLDMRSHFALQWFLAGVGIIILPVMAAIAAAKLSRERERRTLDGLLTLPVDRVQLLRAKLWGVVRGLRPLRWPFLVVLLIGIRTGGMHILDVVHVVLNGTASLAFVVVLGLWCSHFCRTTNRAIALVLVLLALVMVGVPAGVELARHSGFIHPLPDGEWNRRYWEPFNWTSRIDPRSRLEQPPWVEQMSDRLEFMDGMMTPWRSISEAIDTAGGPVHPAVSILEFMPASKSWPDLGATNRREGASWGFVVHGLLAGLLWWHLCRCFGREPHRA